MVLCDILNTHGSEGTDSNMQHDIGEIDAFFTQTVYQFRRKMQACCRCGCGTGLLGIDSLITFTI